MRGELEIFKFISFRYLLSWGAKSGIELIDIESDARVLTKRARTITGRATVIPPNRRLTEINGL